VSYSCGPLLNQQQQETTHMALFRTDPNKQIADTVANLNRLKTDRDEAERTVERYKASAIQLNTDGADKPGVQRAQQAALAAQLAVDTDTGSIVEVEAVLAKQIADRDAGIDRKARLETGNECEARLRESGDIMREGDAFLKRLAEFAGWAEPFTPEAAGVANLCVALRAQLPETLALIQKLVGYHAAAVMAGTAPARLKRVDAPIVASPSQFTVVHLGPAVTIKHREASL
jgi:hypothetical protein